MKPLLIKPKKIRFFARLTYKHSETPKTSTGFDDVYREVAFYIIPTLLLLFIKNDSLEGVTRKYYKICLRFIVFEFVTMITLVRKRNESQ